MSVDKIPLSKLPSHHYEAGFPNFPTIQLPLPRQYAHPFPQWMRLDEAADKRISEARSEIEQQYTREAKSQAANREGGTFIAGWDKASSLMFQNNPDLIRADFLVYDARQRGKRIFKNMIPTLSAGASDSFQVGELSQAFTDPNLRLSSFLSLGNLLQLPTRVYTAKLYAIGAQFSAEQTMRQEVIALYRIFQEKRLIDTEKKALDIQAEIIDVIGGADAVRQASMRLQLDKDLQDWHDRELSWRQKIGDFFMTSYSEVDLSEKTFPKSATTRKTSTSRIPNAGVLSK